MVQEQQLHHRLTLMNNPTLTDKTLQRGETTREVIGAFYKVYDTLGFGFVESVYQRALHHELKKRGLQAECETGVDVWYDDVRVGQFRADMIVERSVIIEIKAAHAFVDADWKQLLNYLHATELEVGLLFNFGPKAAFKRLIYTNDRKTNCQGSSCP